MAVSSHPLETCEEIYIAGNGENLVCRSCVIDRKRFSRGVKLWKMEKVKEKIRIFSSLSLSLFKSLILGIENSRPEVLEF